MATEAYVLITAARNEEATIETTIQSVLSQEAPPQEWVVVNDDSTDRTGDIIDRYARQAHYIKHLRLQRRPQRNFSSQVFAIQSGCAALRSNDYSYLGLLDADLRFPPHYYKTLLVRFREDAQQGIIGGLVVDVTEAKPEKPPRNLSEVAGATQFFRRACYEAQGGLLPIPEGGYDAIACVRARMLGYKTETFPDLVVDHLKPRNAAFGRPLRRKWQLGMRDYALAYHPLFEFTKCCSRAAQVPFFIGAAAWFLGYACAALTRRHVLVPADVRKHIRREQMRRLRTSLLGNNA